MNPEKQQGDESRNLETKKIRGSLPRKGEVKVLDTDSSNALTSRGYGTVKDGKLVLNCYEALFLQSKGVLEVVRGKSRNPLDFQALLHHFESVEANV